MATVGQLTDRVIRRLTIAVGPGVQLHSDLVVRDMIQHKFDTLFDEAWWPQFVKTNVYVLDGTTGTVTSDLSPEIKAFKDIRFIWRTTESSPLPRKGVRDNESLVMRPSFTTHPSATKVFKILPITTTGSVRVLYRKKPDAFINESDVVNMDDQLIILGTAYDYLNALGTNPNEEQKLLTLFTNRLSQLQKTIEPGEISLDSPFNNTGGWQEANHGYSW